MLSGKIGIKQRKNTVYFCNITMFSNFTEHFHENELKKTFLTTLLSVHMYVGHLAKSC
jgi:hypothetical protein